jgi:hypothetical protein
MKHKPTMKGGEMNMKKALMIALMLLISVAFVTTVLAQPKPAEKPAAATPAPAPEKAKAEKAEKPAKAKMMTFKGEVVKYDEAAKTLVAKDKKGEATFDVAGVKKMPAVKDGGAVTVKYAEKDGKKVASSVAAAKAPKEKKEAAPKAEKKEAPKAEPAKPAEPAKK